MNLLGTSEHPLLSHIAPVGSGKAILTRPSPMPAEEEVAYLRRQLAEALESNQQKDATIASMEQTIQEQEGTLRRTTLSKNRLNRELQLTRIVSGNVEKILSDLNSIEVADHISFFDYLMNRMPTMLDCQVRYHIPHHPHMDEGVRVQNGKKSDIFVELLESSYEEIQSIRKTQGLPAMNTLLRSAANLDEPSESEIFPIQIEKDVVGHIEFIRDHAARKMLPDIRPHFSRVMRLIGCHLDKVRYETVIRENARIMAENEALLRAEMHTDVLTGVNNRRGFFAKTVKMLLVHPNVPTYIIAVDIDFFKRVNDVYGHSGGDALLVGVTQTLESELEAFLEAHQRKATGVTLEIVDRRNSKDHGHIWRIGGEEFAIQIQGMNGLEYQEVVEFSEQLRAKIERDFQEFRNGRFNMRPTPITISLGVSKFSERREGEEVEQWQARILEQADTALYHSKHSGRNQVSVFEELSPEIIAQRRAEAVESHATVLPLRSPQATTNE